MERWKCMDRHSFAKIIVTSFKGQLFLLLIVVAVVFAAGHVHYSLACFFERAA